MKSIKNIKKSDRKGVETFHAFVFGMSLSANGFQKDFLCEILDMLRKIILDNKWSTKKQLAEFKADIFCRAELNKKELIKISKGALDDIEKLPSAKVGSD